ncbi:MAG TPA: acylglycerol kinase family protein, partial [Thermoanaerobaculia bacterium]|nr:acylglycerol kinase family protein [Thermoanaerobaculia bacterium]
MRILLIWNPNAGRGRARRHIVEAEAYLRGQGATVEVAASASAPDLTRLAAAASRADYHAVVICGGDGSLNL